MDHRDIHAAQLQAVGGFETEQAAADDHGVIILRRCGDHAFSVGNVAVSQHARQFHAGDRQQYRVGSGRQQQAVVFGDRAVFGAHYAFDTVDLGDLLAQVQRDVVGVIPVEIVEHDLFQRLFTGEHRRQQDAVVVRMRFSTEHGDVIKVRCNLQQFLQRAHAGHAIADADQPHLAVFIHVIYAALSCF